jgi:hypothetical protein
MEKNKQIKIICNYNEEIEKAINEFCYKVSNHKDCLELDLIDGINRTEYKARFEND